MITFLSYLPTIKGSMTSSISRVETFLFSFLIGRYLTLLKIFYTNYHMKFFSNKLININIACL